LTTGQVKSWLKEQAGGKVYVGTVPESEDRCLGVYDGRPSGSQRMCIGGRKAVRYQSKAVDILVHWSDSPAEAERRAREVYGLFYGLSGVDMDGARVVSADPGGQPQWAGRSKRGICEYVIRVNLLYEREDKDA